MKTLRETSAIEDLKALHPNLTYEDGILANGDDLIDSEADELINDHYEGFKVTKAHASNNPELEYDEAVSGKEYVALHFYGDYEEAFNQI
jgi:hypothetical protein